MNNLGKRQKRVIKLIKRTNNIGFYRTTKPYISLIANKNYRITEEQLKAIKMDLLTPKGLTSARLLKYYKINIKMITNKTLTQKGILVRQGKGKGKTKTNVLYLTKGTTCIVFSPKLTNLTINLNLITKILNKVCKKYTFFSPLFLI